MSEWKEYTLSEIGTIARGKSKHRPRDASFLYGGKYPFIQTGDVKASNHKIYNYNQTYSESGLNQSKLWPINTLCITIAANIADTGILTFPACFPDSVIGFVADDSKCDIEFIEYLLQYYKKQIQSHSIGSVQDNINLGTFEKIKFRIPGLITQKAIKEILSSLDDKIELNNKINQELESLAQLLFKRWFLDFEFPNENGEPYKSSGGEMVDSELGEIPKGWFVDTLEKHVNIINGFAFKSEDYTNKGCKIIRTKNFNEKGFLDLNDLVFLTETDSKKYSKFNLQLYDKLVVMVGASIGKSVIVTSNILPALQNQNMWNFRARTREFQAYSNFLTNQLVEQNIGSATGSAREFFRKDFFYSRKIIVPNTEILDCFGDAVFCMYDKLDVLLKENKELISLRETLLPKLITGELQINNK